VLIMDDSTQTAPVTLPRVAITYCTQCRWMLRAAYFAQELLSTFGTSIGEIALIPATGGIFTVYLTHKPANTTEAQSVLIWDRKAEGGFPETKILKQRVRNHIEPDKNLGHSDTPASKTKASAQVNGDAAGISSGNAETSATKTDSLDSKSKAQDCEDCQ